MSRTSARSRRGGAPSLAPLLCLLFLALGGIGAAGYYHGLKRDHTQAQEDRLAERTAREEAARSVDPFASVASEPAPHTKGQGQEEDPWESMGGSEEDESAFSRPTTPLQASEDEAWEKALAWGRKADQLAAEARRAKAKDEHATFQEKGKAAKEAYDRAFTDSVEVELAWIAAWGETDPRVRRMVSIRNAWQDGMRVFHRTTGR